MKTFKFIPEGWNEEEKKISSINEAKNLINTKEILQGKVESYDEDYNLHINLGNGFKGIIPKSEIENTKDGQDIDTKLCVGKLNKYVQFRVEGIEGTDTLLLSRKAVQEEVISSIQKDLEIGQVLTGIVKNIKPYGAFIEIGGGVVGLAHIEDLSIARIKTPYERLKIGQKINIVVKSIDKESGKINLSYKEILGTWEENVQKFDMILTAIWHILTDLKPYTPEGFLESRPVNKEKVLTTSQALNLLKQRGYLIKDDPSPAS